MMSDNAPRKKLAFTQRVAILLFLLLAAYPISLGPTCWILSRFQWDHKFPHLAYAVSNFYEPLTRQILFGPKPVERSMKWWISVGMSSRTTFQDQPRAIRWDQPGYNYTLISY
ncbi:MAG: hypothetical protein HUJ26_23350 [Planctomycetaceae bacterium]|nr:hypothetical protein [Planctomycetaceae bacterium]